MTAERETGVTDSHASQLDSRSADGIVPEGIATRASTMALDLSATAAAATRFILVEPSHPGNIGAAARALKTMGIRQLVLVRPRARDVQRHPDAMALASGAVDVLEGASCAATLEEALCGVHWSAALSARLREYAPPMLTPRAAATTAAHLFGQQKTGADQIRIALVFGNERAGLTNEDVQRCNAIVHIDTNPDYGSLNLAQAVQVVAYELRIAYAALRSPARPSPESPPAPSRGNLMRASSEEVEGMFTHLEHALTALDFFDPAHPKKLSFRLRRLFARADLTREEVNILRGIAKHILLKTKLTS